MKKIFIIILFTLVFPFALHTGTIKEETVGRYKVYITQYKSEADLAVYITDFSTDAKGRDEIWYMDKQFGSIPIEYTKYFSEAHIKVYFTNNRAEAGWLNQSHALKNKLG